MGIDLDLLEEALHELVRLRTNASDPPSMLARLYGSVLQEWADRLNLDPRKLNKLVRVKEAGLAYRLAGHRSTPQPTHSRGRREDAPESSPSRPPHRPA